MESTSHYRLAERLVGAPAEGRSEMGSCNTSVGLAQRLP